MKVRVNWNLVILMLICREIAGPWTGTLICEGYSAEEIARAKSTGGVV